MRARAVVPNKVPKSDGFAAAWLRRVCWARYLTSQVKVLIPGIRRAE